LRGKGGVKPFQRWSKLSTLDSIHTKLEAGGERKKLQDSSKRSLFGNERGEGVYFCCGFNEKNIAGTKAFTGKSGKGYLLGRGECGKGEENVRTNGEKK